MTEIPTNFFFEILLFIVLGSVIVFLLVKIWKNKNKRHFWNFWTPISVLTIILAILTFCLLGNRVFVKPRIVKKLEVHKIKMNEPFTVISNNKSYFIDYSHEFEILISENDKNNIIKEFITDENYIENSGEMYDVRYGKEKNIDASYYATYEDEYNYSYQYYETNSAGRGSTWISINISKKNNNLNYIEVLD